MERKIRIGPRTVEVLKAHRAKQREERMAAASWAESGLVFPNRKGKIRRRDSESESLSQAAPDHLTRTVAVTLKR
jgi:hypothetical protein